MGGALIFSKYHVLDFKHWRDSSAARQGLSIVLAFNTQLAVALVTSFLLGDISVNYARLFVGDYKYCIEFLGRKVYPSLLPIIPRRIEVGVFMLLTSPKLTGSGWVWQKVLRFGQVLGFFLHLFLDAVTGVALLWAVSHPLIAPGLMVHDSSWAQWGAWMRLIFRAMVQFFPLTVWQKQLGRRRRRLAKEKRKGPVSLPGTEAYVLV
jgi:hypothetical protein